MPTYYRWFILPMVEQPDDPTTEKAPKYVHGEDRLDAYGYSAGPFDRTQVEDAGYSHLLAHNDSENWRVVLAWGEGTDAWNALNEIHAHNHDSETLADHGQDVEPVLSRRFGEDGWNLDRKLPPNAENTA